LINRTYGKDAQKKRESISLRISHTKKHNQQLYKSMKMRLNACMWGCVGVRLTCYGVSWGCVGVMLGCSGGQHVHALGFRGLLVDVYMNCIFK
jgi:hypothetical protein